MAGAEVNVTSDVIRITYFRVEIVSSTYVLAIICLRTRDPTLAPEGGVSINRNVPIRHVLIDL